MEGDWVEPGPGRGQGGGDAIALVVILLVAEAAVAAFVGGAGLAASLLFQKSCGLSIHECGVGPKTLGLYLPALLGGAIVLSTIGACAVRLARGLSAWSIVASGIALRLAVLALGIFVEFLATR